MNLDSLRAFAESGEKVLTDVTMTLNATEWSILSDEYPDMFDGVQFTNVDFQEATLIRFSFIESKWINSAFSGIAYRCNFRDSVFEWANFKGAYIQDCIFRNCKIEGTQCTGATFKDVDFRGSSISGMFLGDTKYINNIDLHDTYLGFGVLDGTDLKELKGVSAVNLNTLQYTVYCIHSIDDSFSYFLIGPEGKSITYFIENPQHPYAHVVRFLYDNRK